MKKSTIELETMCANDFTNTIDTSVLNALIKLHKNQEKICKAIKRVEDMIIYDREVHKW